MTASSRGADFIPMIGPEQTIVDLMHDYLTPVRGDDEDTPVIIGQEECAAKIVEWLRGQGVDLS